MLYEKRRAAPASAAASENNYLTTTDNNDRKPEDQGELALRYAAAGTPVFPCDPGTKRPLTPNGFKDASTDPAIIQAWWLTHSGAMIGVPTGAASGWWALDVDHDPAKGVDGNASLAALVAAHGPLPSTRIHRTPRGGEHHIFAAPIGQTVRCSAGTLGPGLDVRGDGGYIIAPGSRRADGAAYTVEQDCPPIAAPGWLLNAVTGGGSQSPRSLPVDTPIPEGGRNDALTRQAGALRRAGLSAEEILSALRTTNARRCNPPLDDEEVVGIARSVARYEPAAPIWEGFSDSDPAVLAALIPKPPAPRIAATPYVWRDPSLIPRRRPLYGYHLWRRYLSVTVAPGALGKSSLKVAEALAMASNWPMLGVPVYEGPLRVWYWNLEDDRDEIERRVAATIKHHRIPPDIISDRLFLDSGREHPLCIARTDREGTIVLEPIVDQLVAALTERQIDVLIVDPFVSSHAVPENDNGAIDAVAKTWGRVADKANCAIDLVHHIRKNGGAETSVEDTRGAKALTDAARSADILNPMSREEAERAGLESPRGYFRVGDGKNNLSPPSVADARWYKFESVWLTNGDNVGVVTKWEWPNPAAEITDADILAVQQAIDGKNLRENAQATDWVGYTVAEVLGLDIEAIGAKAKVKSLLKAWLQSGALVKSSVIDGQRKERPVIEVGAWATCATAPP